MPLWAIWILPDLVNKQIFTALIYFKCIFFQTTKLIWSDYFFENGTLCHRLNCSFGFGFYFPSRINATSELAGVFIYDLREMVLSKIIWLTWLEGESPQGWHKNILSTFLFQV